MHSPPNVSTENVSYNIPVFDNLGVGFFFESPPEPGRLRLPTVALWLPFDIRGNDGISLLTELFG